MHFLVVEGQPLAELEYILAEEMVPGHVMFEQIIAAVFPEVRVDCIIASDPSVELPSVAQLQKYSGVVWTGSALSVAKPCESVHRQCALSRRVFESTVPYYGSCWGLQVATHAAGGSVRLAERGYEVGISEPIRLTAEGQQHPMFKHKPDAFYSYCLHHDEVAELPPGATLLATNGHSRVQAAEIPFLGGVFWGVQYHPEFDHADMLSLLKNRGEKICSNDLCLGPTDIEQKIESIENRDQLSPEIADTAVRTSEILCWLEHAKAQSN